MSKFKIISLLFIPIFLFGWSGTEDNKVWESGDSIDWDVPYQTQKYFRNWTTACMPTSGAMIVNFFYKGAPLKSFHDINSELHPRHNNSFDIDTPYQTTGQRMYAQGIMEGNDYYPDGNDYPDGDLSNYVINYPKNSTYQRFGGNSYASGPMKDERVYSGTTLTKTSENLIGTTQGWTSPLKPESPNNYTYETASTPSNL